MSRVGRGPCTCNALDCGPGSGHESYCGQPEIEEDDPFIDLWVIQPCPTCRWLPELHAGPCLPVKGSSE